MVVPPRDRTRSQDICCPASILGLRREGAPLESMVVISSANIHGMEKHVSEHGLNLVLVDSFTANAHRFGTLAALAQFERTDLIIHFSTVAMKRSQEDESLPVFRRLQFLRGWSRGGPSRFAPEVRERARRLVAESEGNHHFTLGGGGFRRGSFACYGVVRERTRADLRSSDP